MFTPRIFPLLILVFCASCFVTQELPYEEAPTYELFYKELAPHGTWLDSGKYGPVWQPHETLDFRPYVTNGHWIASDYGWTWASGYHWGWAPFHYGRWFYQPPYGWLWQPGYDWSPAWVVWGYADDYYCWAPLMPGVNAANSYSSWSPPAFYWNGCRRRYITRRDLIHSILKPEPMTVIRPRIRPMKNFNTTVPNKLYYSAGPEIKEVQQYVQYKIRRHTADEIRSREPFIQSDWPSSGSSSEYSTGRNTGTSDNESFYRDSTLNNTRSNNRELRNPQQRRTAPVKRRNIFSRD